MEYVYLLDRSIWAIDGTLEGITTPSQSELTSNGNDGILHTFPISRTRSSLAQRLKC